MPWELIHFRLLRPSDSVMKAMCCNQTLNVLPKHCPKKLNKAIFTICFTAKMTTYPKGTTVYTSNIQLGELIHMDFALYNVTSVHIFTSVSTVVFAKTIMLWVFPTESKWAAVHIVHSILKKLKNEQQLWKHVIVDEYSALANSTDVTNLPVDELKISMETTGGDGDREGDKCHTCSVVYQLLRRVVVLSNILNTQYVQWSELQHHTVGGPAPLTIWISAHFQLWLPPNTVYHTRTIRHIWDRPHLRGCHTGGLPWYVSLFIGVLTPHLMNQRGLPTIPTSLVYNFTIDYPPSLFCALSIECQIYIYLHIKCTKSYPN